MARACMAAPRPAPRDGGARDAWALTLEVSLRGRIRVYDRPLPGGTWGNSTRDAAVSDGMPGSPWAVYLGDGTGYQLLCFDMDAHDGTPAARRRAKEDADTCSRLLGSQGIPCLVCASGPTGGRHVWASSLDTLDAADVRAIAVCMQALCPSLDPTPLLNPRTGCARPPYSPHRAGGRSVPVRGSLDAIETPVAGEDQWLSLLDALDAAARRPAPSGTKRRGRATVHGAPAIPGTKRALPRRSLDALDAPARPGEDMSRRLRSVLLGAARAHWTWDDVKALLREGHPGMAHALTARDGGRRVPRPGHGGASPLGVLSREWRSAVDWVASNDPGDGTDHGWAARAARTTDLVMSTLASWRVRAEGDGGARRDAVASDTRVLNALCLLMLRACSPVVQADVRRLSLMTGLSRQTASRSLRRLERGHVIRLARGAQGREANSWALMAAGDGPAPKRDTSGHTPRLTEVLSGTGRDGLMRRLSLWIGVAGHDACGPRGLGVAQGNLLADRLTATGHACLRRLSRLARRLGTQGTRKARERSYALERRLWHWYLAEGEWMRAPRHAKPPRGGDATRPGPWPRMPRDARKRIDWKEAARRLLTRKAGGAPPACR